MEKRVLSALQELGLTSNEASIFKFLLENGGSSTLDMNKYLRIRQPQLYDVLLSLERKGMINVIEGRPKIYETVSLEIILRQIEDGLKENKKFLTRWEELSGSKDITTPAIWMSRTWRSFRSNTVSLLSDSTNSLMIETPFFFLEELMDELDRLDLKDQRIFLLVYGNGMSDSAMEKIKSKSYFSDIAALELGQFFAIVEDEKSSSFMPRNIMEREKSERYGYIFKDKDMTWFVIHNFFMGWFESRLIKRTVATVGTVYTNQRFALYDITHLLKTEKKEVWVRISGYDKKEKSDVELEGYVESVVTTNNVFNFNVRTRSGESYSIGGYDSKGERVEAYRITLIAVK